MIRSFKSFKEDNSSDDTKMKAIAEKFYIDLSDIFINISNYKYHIRLIKFIESSKDIYAINIIVNDYESIKDDIANKVLNLNKEFKNHYNLIIIISLSPYHFSENQKILLKKGDESFDNDEKVKYLNDVSKALNDLRVAYSKLESLWYEDIDHELDLNDYLSDDYPFESSFGDIDIPGWVYTSIDKIENKINFNK